MKLGSLFDGSGGFPLAGTLCGIEPVWAAEVEPYPIAVTSSRFPKMRHLGSVTDIHGGEVEPVDIITFGSPCQDLSVAGKRAGLKHEANGDEETTRSGLFMEAVRIIKEMRKATDGLYPTFAVWENVPGAFSSNKGEDFRIVLEELIKIVEPGAVMPTVPQKGWAYADSYLGDGWSLAYRTLDAQYWGVPQRRRRIYLVLDLRGERAHKVLFEREGLRGYFTQGRAPWKATARKAENCPGAADSEGAIGLDGYNATTTGDVSATLGVNCGMSTGRNGVIEPVAFAQNQRDEVRDLNGVAGALAAEPGMKQQTFICMATQQGGAEIRTDDKAPTITAAAGMSGNNQPVVCYEDVVDQNILDDQGGSNITVRTDGQSPTLRAEMHGNVPCVMDAITLEPGIAAREGGHIYEGVCGTLRANAGDNQMAVAYSFDSLASNSMKSKNPHSGCRVVEVAKTLDTTDPNPCKNQGGIAIVEQYLFENHSQDSRYKGPLDVCPMLPAQLGTGGNNQPFVVEQTPFRKGTRPHSADEAQKWEHADVANTLNTFDVGEVRANELVVEKRVYESHPMDSRIKELDGVAPTVSRKWHKGAADTPLVCEATIPIHDQTVYCLQGNGIDRADTAGCNGKGVKEDICYTLNTIDRPAVCYAETYQKVTGPLMANSHPGSYCGQDAYQDMLVVGKEIPSVGINGDIAGTLDASYYKGCGMRQGVEREVVAFDRAAFNQGQNAQYTPQYYTDGTVPTLVAKGPSGVAYKAAVRYIVRRLTPTECARLQGFPDTWGHINHKENLTDEEYRFWLEVRNTHAAINGKATKEYTKEQMLTWYSKLHTDSAEYKMWGNGIALPCARYVMEGIAEVSYEVL